MNPRRNSRLFDEIKAEWDAKLAKSGFIDQEDRRGNLKQHDRRLKSFTDRDNVLEFFLRLDAFLNERKDIPVDVRQILELYSAGTQMTEISEIMNRDRKTIFNIIRRYRTGSF